LGKLLDRVDDERRSLVIEKRGTSKAVLLSIRDYVKLASPEPEVLKIIGEESERNRTNTLTSRQIDQVIKATGQALMLPLRLVIDTNVLVSAALEPESLQRASLLLARCDVTGPRRRRSAHERLDRGGDVGGGRVGDSCDMEGWGQREPSLLLAATVSRGRHSEVNSHGPGVQQ
jgi:prevent-host-death family protein